MSQETLELPHGKHHQAYVAALNGFVEAQPDLQGKTLEEIVAPSHGDPARAGVFNQAGQHWNHIHFWQALSPEGGRMPGRLEARIVADFGSLEAFREAFKGAATGQFGSGWAWRIQKPDGGLAMTRTPSGVNPLATGEGTALPGLDGWEHSDYVDFRNRRPGAIRSDVEPGMERRGGAEPQACAALAGDRQGRRAPRRRP